MISRHKPLLAGAGLVGALGLGSITAGTLALAAHAPGPIPPAQSSLQLLVDKPIIHLGETVLLLGRHYTAGAIVTVYLHGPFVATLGHAYGRRVVDRHGDFALRIRVAGYPDAQARLWHTVDVAAPSSARLSSGAVEGAMVPVQVDPMLSTGITTRAVLKWASLTIDGNEVKAQVAARDATHYSVSYTGHLRAGIHSAYLKWGDVSGAYGARSWSFRSGSPYVAGADPRLSVDKSRIHLGDSVLLSGRSWTPGATVTIRLGGLNTPPSNRSVGRAVVDGQGAFTMRIRVAAYPAANARQSGVVMVAASAAGAVIGDLPEGAALPIAIE